MPLLRTPDSGGIRSHYLTTCTATSIIRNRPLRALKHILRYLALDPTPISTITYEAPCHQTCPDTCQTVSCRGAPSRDTWANIFYFHRVLSPSDPASDQR